MSIVSIDYTGKMFGFWTSLGRCDRRRDKERVLCVCGRETLVNVYDLIKHRTKSCGCRKSALVSRAKVKHGHGNGTPEYRSWRAAIERCESPSNKRYGRYGARGIKVCDRWRNSFELFLEDMGERPSSAHQLDRIDNDGHYEPGNCRWVTAKTNMRNMSRNRKVCAFGQEKTLQEWSETNMIKRETIAARLDRGWSPDEAVSHVVDVRFHKRGCERT